MGAHTQIWNANIQRIADVWRVPRENQLINANYGQEVSNTSIAKVDDDILVGKRSISVSGLWDLGFWLRPCDAGTAAIDQIWPLTTAPDPVVQAGGIPSDAAYASRKHYIASKEPITDFIKS